MGGGQLKRRVREPKSRSRLNTHQHQLRGVVLATVVADVSVGGCQICRALTPRGKVASNPFTRALPLIGDRQTHHYAVSGGLSGFGPRSFFVLELLLTGTCWKPHSFEPYSYRRATTGSTRIARRAGGYDASRATTRNEIETTTK